MGNQPKSLFASQLIRAREGGGWEGSGSFPSASQTFKTFKTLKVSNYRGS